MISNKKSLLALSVASALALSGCFSDDDNNVVIPPPPDPTDPVTVIQPPEDLVTEQPAKVFSVNVVNKANSDVLEGAIVKFLVNGQPATVITDVNGTEISSVTVDDTGNFNFFSKEGASGSVTAVVSQSGYVSKSFIIDLSTEVEEGFIDIPLEFGLVAANTAGLKSAQQTATVASATTSAAVTANASEAGASSTVTVPANTVLRDADDEPVTGTEITLDVLAADASNTDATAIIPEGLNANSTTQVKTTLGVTNITMSDENGTKIKNFSSPINVSVNLPADSGVTAGDTLSISSHNEDTGTWSSETNMATVGAANTDGSFPASFETDHLTFFSIGKNAPLCTAGITLRLVGNIPARGLAIELSSTDGTIGSYTRKEVKAIIPASSAARYGISSNATAKVRLYDYSGNVWYNSQTEVPVCGEVTANIESTVETFDKNVTLNGVCAQDATVSADLSGSIVTYAKNGKAAGLAQAQGDSTFKLSGIEAGASYKVRATIRGAKVDGGGQSQTFTFENVQNDNNALTGTVNIECNEVPVTGS
ncbi:hypothetical protein [Pseudoalteromonas galatheae]|uniref:hypothetical protein n=1 Tax=Pseudoalteromonas galatheae TaxID=579562 RepID=UPI0030CDEC0C